MPVPVLNRVRTFLYGYAVNHVSLIRREIDPNVHVREHSTSTTQPPRAVSLGVHCLQGALCVPQGNGLLNQECGLAYRLGRKMPKPSRRVLWQLRGYMPYFCQRLFPNIVPADYDFSAENWLSKTHYPEWRKMQILKLLPDIPSLLTRAFFRKFGHCKAFIKLENYSNGTHFEWGTYKPPRIISSRTDYVKLAVGPLIKAIELLAYDCPFFVKHVPVHERPMYIENHLRCVGMRYMASDYTSFECGFTPEFMHVVEFGFFRYMLANCPKQLAEMKAFEQCVTGRNQLHLRDVSASMLARRQSGEMTTSIGNGISNLVMTAFLLRHRVDVLDMRCVVEGDDGLFAVPIDCEKLLAPDNYAQFGFLIKSSWTDDVCSASFCGLVYDSDDSINVCNPVDVILSIGWSMGSESVHASDKRLKDLLVAKTYSLVYEYAGCPIVWAIADWLVRVNGILLNEKLFNSRMFNDWERAQVPFWRAMNFRRLLSLRPTRGSRTVMAESFGIPLDVQVRWENYFQSLTTICPINLPEIYAYLSPMAIDNVWRVQTHQAGVSWSTIDNFV